MAEITKEIRQRVADYVKANGRFTSRRDVVKGMTETPGDEIKAWGLSKSQIEDVVRDTPWPGEKRKGKVLYYLSKSGDTYGSIDDALKDWEDSTVEYRVESDGYDSNRYKVEKIVFDGKNRERVAIAKHLSRKWAEEYVLHQIDSSLPKPGKIVGRDKLEVIGKAVLTSDIADALKYAKPNKGLNDITDRPVFILKGQEEGVIVDGFLLIENRKAADKVLGTIEKAMDKKGWFEGSAKKKADYIKEAKYPNYKNLYPSEYPNTWKILGVHYADGIHRVYLTNGHGEFGTADLDKFAFIIENLPDGKLTAIKSELTTEGGVWGDREKFLTSPLTFFVDNKPVALLMPLFTPPSLIPLPIKEAAGVAQVPEGAVPATVIDQNPPMTFAQVYKSVLKRKDTNKKSAVYTAVREILDGYKDTEEAHEDAKSLRETGGRRYSAWGYEIGPDTIEKALKVKAKLHPSGMSKSVADGFLKSMIQRIQEYYDRGYTRDIPKGAISAELVRHEYAPVGGNRDWWLEQAQKLIDKESKSQRGIAGVMRTPTSETDFAKTTRQKPLKDMSKAELKSLRVILHILPDGTLEIKEKGTDSLERGVASWRPPNRPDMTEKSWVGGYIMNEMVSENAKDWLDAVAEKYDLDADEIVSDPWHGGGMRHKASPYSMLTNIVTGKVKTASGSDTVIDKATDLQAIHDSRSSRSRESDEWQSNADTVELDDPRVEQWLKDQGRMDVVGIDTPTRKRKAKSLSKRRPSSARTETQVRGLR